MRLRGLRSGRVVGAAAKDEEPCCRTGHDARDFTHGALRSAAVCRTRKTRDTSPPAASWAWLAVSVAGRVHRYTRPKSCNRQASRRRPGSGRPMRRSVGAAFSCEVKVVGPLARRLRSWPPEGSDHWPLTFLVQRSEACWCDGRCWAPLPAAAEARVSGSGSAPRPAGVSRGLRGARGLRSPARSRRSRSPPRCRRLLARSANGGGTIRARERWRCALRSPER